MKTYAVRSTMGTRYWHADDPEHAEAQHLADYDDEPILSIYEVEHHLVCDLDHTEPA